MLIGTIDTAPFGGTLANDELLVQGELAIVVPVRR